MPKVNVLTEVVETAPTFLEKANDWISARPLETILIVAAVVVVAGFVLYKKVFKK